MSDVSFSFAPAGAAALALALCGMALASLALYRARRTREALRLSVERLRFALEATSEIVWDWNLAEDGIYHPRWAATYGYPVEKTPRTGEELGRFIHPEDLPVFAGLVEEAKGGRRDAFEFEHRALAASGEWRWMVARARVVSRDGRGRALRMVGTCTDVTERRKLAARLQIADRLASVGTLAAGVAHEINNPLSAVLAALEAAVGTPPASGGAAGTEPAPEVREGLGDALSAARRMRTIVSDLRVFSRVEEPNGLVDVETVLESMLRMAWSEIRHRAHVVRAYQSVPKVKGNESRLGQVFLNLIMNAAQAIDEGSADRNEIGVAIRLDPRQRVLVEIRDTGCGMPPEVVRHIFTPFFTTKPSSTGTGLGLSICQRIIDAMGGEITAENAHGRGSVFRVHLPTAAGEPSLRTGPAAPASAPAPRRGRVLVIDDEAMVARAASRILARDHDVTVATGARAGLEHLARGEPFDVILCDLMMPEVSGIDLHAEICRSYPERRASLIFMSGGVFSTKARSFVSEHPEAVVVEKPFDAARLQALVQARLGGDGRG